MSDTTIELAQIAQGIGGFALRGERPNDRSGSSVASAGDFNGDGFDDLFIGAPGADGPGGATPYAGASYVVFGGADPFPATIDLRRIAAGEGGFVIRGEDNFDYSGRRVASAGDLDGDGFDDLLIGAGIVDYNGYGGYARAAVYVVYGQAAPIGDGIDLADIAAGDGGFVATVSDYANGVSAVVGSAGDVNGDGFDDFVLGDPNGYEGNPAGAAYLVFGAATRPTGPLDLDALLPGRGVVISASYGYAAIGTAIGAGDINGDGFDDAVLGGAYGVNYVVFGRAAGFPARLDVRNLAVGEGFEIVGAYAGYAVAAAGDFNGDGYADILLGAPSEAAIDPVRPTAGNTYLIFGRPEFTATVDLADVARGEGGFLIRGESTGDRAGAAVAFAGDVNGDGFDDLLVGAPDADGTGDLRDRAGSVYVVLGTATGPTQPFDLTSIAAGQGGFVIQGETAGDRAGFAVAAAGDLNGDGFDDLVVGARDSDAGGRRDAGTSYVIFGSASVAPPPDPIRGTPRADTLPGTVGDDLIEGRANDDLLLGGGGADTLLGGAGQDVLRGDEADDRLAGGAGDDSLAGGSGDDTLVGGAGRDTMVGGRGADRLIGGAGADVFRFESRLADADRIADFVSTVDVIQISRGGFGGGLAIGQPPPLTFGTAAIGDAAQFLFDAATGSLLFDRDGAGGDAGVLVATLAGGAGLVQSDFDIVA